MTIRVIARVSMNRLRISLVYVLTLGVNLAFNVLIRPKLPLLRDSLITTAVVTIVMTAVIAWPIINLLSIRVRGSLAR